MQINDDTKKRVVAMRARGKTYAEIRSAVGINIPKSSLSYWCKKVVLPAQYQNRAMNIMRKKLQKNRQLAIEANRRKYLQRIENIEQKFQHLDKILNHHDISLIILATLYLGEGTKGNRGSITFGNSNPGIIGIFLKLLRRCFIIDETKFRCTVQGRADMDIPMTMQYWSKISRIPMSQFYSSRIDSRTIGKKSSKLGYHGVCRIDYLSAETFHSLMAIGNMICGPEAPLDM
jgi:hypothetical protein